MGQSDLKMQIDELIYDYDIRALESYKHKDINIGAVLIVNEHEKLINNLLTIIQSQHGEKPIALDELVLRFKNFSTEIAKAEWDAFCENITEAQKKDKVVALIQENAMALCVNLFSANADIVKYSDWKSFSDFLLYHFKNWDKYEKYYQVVENIPPGESGNAGERPETVREGDE